MKQFFSILLSLLLLAGCTGGSNADTQDLSHLPNTAGGEETAAPEESSPDADNGADPRADMEDYETVEIAFIGVCPMDGDVMEVVQNASSYEKLSYLKHMTESDIVRGQETMSESNVYYILPAENTDLTIGRYSWHADDITDVYYEQENSGPIIFVETADCVSPLSLIRLVRHLDNDSYDDSIYTGFSLASSRLRTDYHMGVVDITPYDQFTSAEVPFYKQGFFDRLMEVAEIQQAVDKGAKLSVMDEMIYEGYAYAVYDLEGEDGSHRLYGITSDPAAEYGIISTVNYETWEPVGMG
ncbi:MAG: hypothetical protein J6S26_01000 [Solobacterium sp.]|nr:hypothetical protein [Solobacterium sp.]